MADAHRIPAHGEGQYDPPELELAAPCATIASGHPAKGDYALGNELLQWRPGLLVLTLPPR